MSMDHMTDDVSAVRRGGLIGKMQRVHSVVFDGIERVLDGWLVGLAGRLVFASVLGLYYYNSGLTKLGEGIFGFVMPV